MFRKEACGNIIAPDMENVTIQCLALYPAAEREDDSDRGKPGASVQPHADYSDSAGPHPTHSGAGEGQQEHSG